MSSNLGAEALHPATARNAEGLLVTRRQIKGMPASERWDALQGFLGKTVTVQTTDRTLKRTYTGHALVVASIVTGVGSDVLVLFLPSRRVLALPTAIIAHVLQQPEEK